MANCHPARRAKRGVSGSSLRRFLPGMDARSRHALCACGMTLLSLASRLRAQRASNPLLDSARTRVAVIDGTIKVPGLDSSVEVRRDRWGVPHIYAKTQHDLFFAQGYVAAQDR